MVIGEAAATACKRGEGKGGSDHGLRVSTMGGSASLGKYRSERSSEGDLWRPAVKMMKMAVKRSTAARFLRHGDEVLDGGASGLYDAATGGRWLRVCAAVAGCALGRSSGRSWRGGEGPEKQEEGRGAPGHLQAQDQGEGRVSNTK